jgi:PmbA protein
MNAKGNYFGNIDFTNLSIEHKNKIKFDELEDNTLLIQNIIGAHGANPQTTEFSVNVEKAFLIKNKERIPVTDFMISGKMFDFLNNSSAVIKNPLKYESNFTNSLLSDTNVTLRK